MRRHSHAQPTDLCFPWLQKKTNAYEADLGDGTGWDGVGGRRKREGEVS